MGKETDIETVEITSIDGKDAWVKRRGNREKVTRDSLFADATALSAVIEQEQQQNEQIRKQWDALKRWEPQP